MLTSFVAPLLAPLGATQDRTETTPRNVAMLVDPGVELLAFAGPGEIFAVAHVPEGHAFHVYTVARSREPVVSMGFATITPEYTLEDCPEPDIVVGAE